MLMHLANFVVAALTGAGLAFPLEGRSVNDAVTVTVFPASCSLPSPSTAVGPSTTFTNLSITPTTQPASAPPNPPSVTISFTHPNLSSVTTFFTHPDTTTVPDTTFFTHPDTTTVPDTTFFTHPDTTTAPATTLEPFRAVDVVTVTAAACPVTGSGASAPLSLPPTTIPTTSAPITTTDVPPPGGPAEPCTVDFSTCVLSTPTAV